MNPCLKNSFKENLLERISKMIFKKDLKKTDTYTKSIHIGMSTKSDSEIEEDYEQEEDIYEDDLEYEEELISDEDGIRIIPQS